MNPQTEADVIRLIEKNKKPFDYFLECLRSLPLQDFANDFENYLNINNFKTLTEIPHQIIFTNKWINKTMMTITSKDKISTWEVVCSQEGFKHYSLWIMHIRNVVIPFLHKVSVLRQQSKSAQEVTK